MCNRRRGVLDRDVPFGGTAGRSRTSRFRFATDLSEAALAKARGTYQTTSPGVSPNVCGAFHQAERSVPISKAILCVRTARPDRPLFSRLDLITCRNVLIYLNRLQEAVFETFHYAPVRMVSLDRTGRERRRFLGAILSVDEAQDLLEKAVGAPLPLCAAAAARARTGAGAQPESRRFSEVPREADRMLRPLRARGRRHRRAPPSSSSVATRRRTWSTATGSRA
jgi:hypothetical protein